MLNLEKKEKESKNPRMDHIFLPTENYYLVIKASIKNCQPESSYI